MLGKKYLIVGHFKKVGSKVMWAGKIGINF